jgi:hypothetical protein
MNDDIQQLIRDGIAAARSGDKATARELLEQATELDENNEKAWFWLASVMPTDEERRVCLGQVLAINPNNEKAQQILDKLNARKKAASDNEEVVPGISRRQLMLIGGGGAVIVVLLLVALFLILNANARQEGERVALQQTQTQVAAAPTQTVMAISAEETTVALTQEAIASSTPTPRPVSSLPPTFTPTPEITPTSSEDQALFPAPPSEITGNIVGWGGRDLLSNGALEILLFPVNGEGSSVRVGEELGRSPRFSGTGERITYTRWFNATYDYGVDAVNTNGTQQQQIPSSIPVLNMNAPDFCSVANRIVFSAIPQQRPDDIENIQFDDVPPAKIFITDAESGMTIQITEDTATYSDPAFSPDCNQVVVIRNDINSANAGEDVFVIDVNSRNMIQLTHDRGDFIERTPRWSPDGSQIIYAAAPSTNPESNDIWTRNADGSGTPIPVVRGEFDNREPVISPDGQYIAFASNRSQAYNIFIHSLAENRVLWQLTNGTELNYYPGDWH